jgi:hypothetical protein
MAVCTSGGFDNREILRLIQGEKKARYNFTSAHVKMSFLFLNIGITMSILSTLFSETFIFMI